MTGNAPRPGMVWRLWLLHASTLLVIVVGVSPFALLLCAVSLWLRIFGLTAGYHRLFSHRAYSTSRIFTFVLAWLGASSGQRGPLWWASRHRQHHRFADRQGDPHSPLQGRFHAHMGWLLARDSFDTDDSYVQDWVGFPELRWLNRFHVVPPLLWGVACFGVGALANALVPGLGTSGGQCVVWGFIIATLGAMHIVSSVNSLAHASTLGRRAHDTNDLSRNIGWLALPTLGDSWHNNHHAFPRSARHGLRPSEIDVTFAALRVLQHLHLVWDLREPNHSADADGGLAPISER